MNNLFIILKAAILLAVVLVGFVHVESPVSATFIRYTEPPALSRESGFGAPESVLFSSTYWSKLSKSLLAPAFCFAGYNNVQLAVNGRRKRTQQVYSYIVIVYLAASFYLWGFMSLKIQTTRIKQERHGSTQDARSQIKSIGQLLSTFYGYDTAKRVVSALIAFSAFGNIAVMASTAVKVKQTVAKEGVLPFSLYFANRHHRLHSWDQPSPAKVYLPDLGSSQGYQLSRQSTISEVDFMSRLDQVILDRRSIYTLAFRSLYSRTSSFFMPRTSTMSMETQQQIHSENSSPFSQMLNSPQSSTSLRRALLSIPKEDIWFNQSIDRSLSNQLKCFAENTTLRPWNWWPLQPRMRHLEEGESRLNWKCAGSPFRITTIILLTLNSTVESTYGSNCPNPRLSSIEIL